MAGRQQDIPQHALSSAGLGRRRFLRTGPALAAAALALPAGIAQAAGSADTWFATWGAAPEGPPTSANTLSFSNQTLRLIVRASAGGSRVRVRLTNEMGSSTLRIGAASIGLRSSGASLVAGSERDLRFSGSPTAVLPIGAALVSDPVDLAVPAFADVAVSLYLPDSVQATTTHELALQNSYLSSTGNYAATPSLPVQAWVNSWTFLSEVDVAGTGATLVALGDSITDGVHSTINTNHRWPDFLAQRLQSQRVAGSAPVGVVNRGISGNSLLTEYPTNLISGHSALGRFDRDVLATSGARWLAVLIGINDLIYSSASSPIPAASLEGGYLQLIARARMHGMAVLGATMTPFEGQTNYVAAREAVRSQVNNWIRTSGAFDAVADFDLALRDPAQPTRIKPAFDSGDHLHPNDAGYQALANAVPLALFG
jgi:lysophospholipase L1-like esterase